MRSIKFNRTCDHGFPCSSMTDKEGALALAKFLVESGDTEGCRYSSCDNFEELNAVVPFSPSLAYRCIASPCVLDERSVTIDDCGGWNATYLRYQTKQEFLYFCPESVSLDVAVTMASVAVACGDVEESMVISHPAAQRWEISVPEGIPAEVLAEAFGTGKQMNAYIIPRKEAAV